MDERKRDSIVSYLRHRMEEFGITPDDLALSLASEQDRMRYRNATGETWDGEGEMPQWLKHAVSAGQSIEHFELSSARAVGRSIEMKNGVDWRNDPFSGSPLATQGDH